MPYIKKQYRELLDKANEIGDHPVNPGELNYCITMLIKHYIEDKNLCYDTINDIMGAIEGAKAEFYRRVAGPYEDLKIKENGDVYGKPSLEV